MQYYLLGDYDIWYSQVLISSLIPGPIIVNYIKLLPSVVYLFIFSYYLVNVTFNCLIST